MSKSFLENDKQNCPFHADNLFKGKFKNKTSIDQGIIFIDVYGIYDVLADNRFYNGADTELIAALFKSETRSEQIAYAAWNTSGNTLGSSIALGVLRVRMAKSASNFSHYKKLLFARFIEDWVYMTIGRDEVRNDLQRQNLKEFAQTKFEREYELKMKDLFNLHAVEINNFLKSDFSIGEVYFPWHRPFEVGFTVESGKISK